MSGIHSTLFKRHALHGDGSSLFGGTLAGVSLYLPQPYKYVKNITHPKNMFDITLLFKQDTDVHS